VRRGEKQTPSGRGNWIGFHRVSFQAGFIRRRERGLALDWTGRVIAELTCRDSMLESPTDDISPNESLLRSSPPGASRGGDRRPAAQLLVWLSPARFSRTVSRLNMAMSRTACTGPSATPERVARATPGAAQGASGVLTRLPIMPAGDPLWRIGRGSAGVHRLAALGQGNPSALARDWLSLNLLFAARSQPRRTGAAEW